MGHDWSDDILIAKLPAEPRVSYELNAVTRLISDKPTSDLLVDIGAVHEPTYRTLHKLTELCGLLRDRGRCCVFFNVSPATKRIFELYGFNAIFEIAAASEIVLKPSAQQLDTGTLELRSSDNAGPFERRRYVRLHIPSNLAIHVLIWHGGRKDDYHKTLPGHCWQGRLVDISEGGAQVAIDAAEGTTLGKGRLVGLEFRPNPTEPMLTFDAQIREMLPTADEKNTCLGLQFVALEANPEGRYGLERLCHCAGMYYEVRKLAAV